jgi:hypothetical protein
LDGGAKAPTTNGHERLDGGAEAPTTNDRAIALKPLIFVKIAKFGSKL